MKRYNNGKTEWYQSPLLHCPHGFSTRVGGFSTAPLVDGLNLTVTQRKGENRENVLKNLAIFAEAVGVSAATVLSVPECNGIDVAYVTEQDAGKGYYHNVGLNYFLNGNKCYDGYVTDRAGITIGMKTADCLPILFAAEDETGILAVGGAHVGCKDDPNNPMCNIATIALQVVSEMKNRFSISASQLSAAMGPAAQSCCCRVSDIIVDCIAQTVPAAMLARFVRKTDDQCWMLDMFGLNRNLLLSCGVPESRIDMTEICTVCSQDPPFFSRIRDGAKTGSMLSVIAMPHGK